ncbi:MAG: cytochrome c biogenesis protein CcdA [Actinobacteria bacterium]|nr:cytochrome c biogenesis protein CcdA [Actinomycetota bacterium]
MNPGDIVGGGTLALALPISFAAGLLAFLSPCVLPLVPGYLGYVTGATDPSQLRRGRTTLGAALFVLGFSIVFLGISVLGATVGLFVLQYGSLLERIGGVLIIIVGFVFIGQVTFLQRQFKPSWRPRAGLAGAPLLGAVFAIGWTPCLGPTLVAMTALASYQGDLGRAAIVGLFYCIGLGIPFLLVALGFGWVGSSVAWVRRHIRVFNIVGGAALIVMGLLMVTGLWGALMSSFLGVVSSYVPAL